MNYFSKSIEAIKADNKSGSALVLKKTILSLLELVNGDEPITKGIIINTLNSLLIAQRELVVLRHFVNSLFLELETVNNNNALKPKLESFLNNYSSYWHNVDEQIANYIIRSGNLNNKTILLHSYSHTIYKLFQCFKKNGIKINVIQTESRPMREGRIMAEKLVSLGNDVKVIADAAFMRYLPEADLVVLGADSVCSNTFVNKIGTHAIVLGAKTFNKPVFVTADTRKFVPFTWAETPRDPNEIWQNAPVKVYPENYYFESVPNRLVYCFITEEGPVTGLNKTRDYIRKAKTSSLMKTISH